MPRYDTNLLLLIEPLIDASLSSSHKAIVNQAIYLWNGSFGLATEVEYPPSILAVLRRLRLATDILTPGLLPDSDECIEVRNFSLDIEFGSN